MDMLKSPSAILLSLHAILTHRNLLKQSLTSIKNFLKLTKNQLIQVHISQKLRFISFLKQTVEVDQNSFIPPWTMNKFFQSLNRNFSLLLQLRVETLGKSKVELQKILYKKDKAAVLWIPAEILDKRVFIREIKLKKSLPTGWIKQIKLPLKTVKN